MIASARHNSGINSFPWRNLADCAYLVITKPRQHEKEETGGQNNYGV
jgi:hypothetical protein